MSGATKVPAAPRSPRYPDPYVHTNYCEANGSPVANGMRTPRPHHARRKSSKHDDHPVSAIRSAFKRVLPKSWAERKSFTHLALDFYTAAIGLTSVFLFDWRRYVSDFKSRAGVCVDDFSLGYLETVMLALELSRVSALAQSAGFGLN
jgi:hypothetical protein